MLTHQLPVATGQSQSSSRAVSIPTSFSVTGASSLAHNSPYRGLLPPALPAPPQTGSASPPRSSSSELHSPNVLRPFDPGHHDKRKHLWSSAPLPLGSRTIFLLPQYQQARLYVCQRWRGSLKESWSQGEPCGLLPARIGLCHPHTHQKKVRHRLTFTE